MSLTPILARALRLGGLFALAVAVVAGVVGFLVGRGPGLAGGLLGAVLAAVFLGLTAGSMLYATRVTRGDTTSPLFFGIVLGVWLVKLIVFILVAVLLHGQPWLDPAVFGFTAIAAAIGTLVVDILALGLGRTPRVDVQLPGDSTASTEKSSRDS